MKCESSFQHRLIGKLVIKTVDSAVLTILTDVDQDFTLRVSDLPAWSFGIRINRVFVNISGTVHELPARVFVLPEIGHFFPP